MAKRIRVEVTAEYDLPPLTGETDETLVKYELQYLDDELPLLFPSAAHIYFQVKEIN